MQIGETQGFGEMRTAASAAATQAAETTEAAKAAEAKKENEKKSIAFQSGDTVEISKQGMTLAASTAAPAKAAQEESTSKEDTLLKNVKDRIKQLQEEIQELQGSNMDEKEKQQKVAMLNQELATQNATLQELQGKDSSGSASRYGQGGLVF